MENQLHLYVASTIGKKNKKYESKALQNKILWALHQKQQVTYKSTKINVQNENNMNWTKWNSIITLKIWNTKLNWAMSTTELPNHDDQKLKSKVIKQESQNKIR